MYLDLKKGRKHSFESYNKAQSKKYQVYLNWGKPHLLSEIHVITHCVTGL